MFKENCIFCEIAQKKARANIVFENDKFIGFDNIKPAAPVHVLIIPKEHLEKEEVYANPEIWSGLMKAAYEFIIQQGLDKTGFRIVNNGAGYHVINHEHIHILGGLGWRPADDL